MVVTNLTQIRTIHFLEIVYMSFKSTMIVQAIEFEKTFALEYIWEVAPAQFGEVNGPRLVIGERT